jgi:phospholipid/cholesterol/gamma-HCH transport system substrate-binding protein
MNVKLNKEIKIAVLGIVAIVLFVFGYNYLKGNGAFSSSKKILVEYDNVLGLTPSSYVQIQGFNVGTVKSIELSKKHPGKILVTLVINEDVTIPSDSKARIISLDLLGTKAVNLITGTASTPVKEEEYLQGDVEFGTIEALGAAATPAIDQAKITLTSLDQTVHNINNILDEQSQANLKNSISNLNKTMADFSQFATELNAQRAKISTLLNNLNSFAANLDQNNSTINRLLTNTETTTSKLSKIDFDGTINELKQTMDELQVTLQKMNNGNGSMALLMNDDKLYRNLKNTLATANNLLADVNARPSRYINVAIFGKKNKNECPPQPAPNAND